MDSNNLQGTFFLHLKSKLEKVGLRQSESDACLFISDKVICLVYVDDTLLYPPKQEFIDEIIAKLREEEMELESQRGNRATSRLSRLSSPRRFHHLTTSSLPHCTMQRRTSHLKRRSDDQQQAEIIALLPLLVELRYRQGLEYRVVAFCSVNLLCP
jgi:hypothetical protein